MTIHYIFVNQHTIRRNRKTGEREPPIGVRRGKRGKARYVNAAELPGGAVVIYDPDNPLPCGATCWIETPSVAAGDDALAVNNSHCVNPFQY